MRVDLAVQPPFELGRARVTPATCEIAWPGGRETLQPLVMQVLVRLAAARGEVVSRDSLIADCWGGRVVGEDAIFRVLARLRQVVRALGDPDVDLETIPRVGYRLTVPLAPAPDAPVPGRRIGRRAALIAGGAALVLATGGAAALLALRRPRVRDPLTLAVLPFADLSAAPGGGLSPGLTQALREALSRIGGLRVIAEASSSTVARAQLSPAAAAARLGADLLLNGAVTEASGAVRLSLELLDPGASVVAWSQTETGRADDLFRLLDAAAGAAAQALVGRAGPARLRAPPALRRRDPAAFRDALQAGQRLDRSRALRLAGRDAEAQAAADQAWALAQAALALDPGDVPALLVLATATRNGGTRALAARPATAAQRAAAAAPLLRRALAADPSDPAALTALADDTRRFDWRWAEAETLFRRALSANPSLVEAHWAYAHALAELGRAREGLAHAREVVRLDPLNAARRVALPRLLYLTGQRDPALQRYDLELAAAPADAALVREIYVTHLAEANPGALRRLHTRLADLWRGQPLPAPVAALAARAEAAAAALRGAPQALLALVAADVAAVDRPDLLFTYALEYAWAGATDPALALLARALAARAPWWIASLPDGPAEFPPALRRDPRYAALWRSDPRLAALVAARRTARANGQTAAPFRRAPDRDRDRDR